MQAIDFRFDQFVATCEAKCPKAVQCLVKAREALLAFYDFPAEHWVHLRTTNPISPPSQPSVTEPSEPTDV
jgi:transposase-like protein